MVDLWDAIEQQNWLPAVAALIAACIAVMVGIWNGGPSKRTRDAMKTDVETLKLLAELKDKSGGELPKAAVAVQTLVTLRLAGHTRGFARLASRLDSPWWRLWYVFLYFLITDVFGLVLSLLGFLGVLLLAGWWTFHDYDFPTLPSPTSSYTTEPTPYCVLDSYGKLYGDGCNVPTMTYTCPPQSTETNPERRQSDLLPWGACASPSSPTPGAPTTTP